MRLRRTLFPVIAVLLVAGASPVGADELRDKQAEAERIAAQVEEQGRQVSILAERVNEARLRAQQVEADVAASAVEAARTEAEVAAATETLKRYVVQSYIRGGRLSEFSMLVGGGSDDSVEELAVRNAYVKSITAGERAAIDALAEARDRHDARRRSLAAAQREARQALAKVEAEQKAAAAAEAQAQATLARIHGDMAQLVAEAERRRAEAAEREAAAALAASTTTTAAGTAGEPRRSTTTTTTARSPGSSPTTQPPADDPAPAPSPAPGVHPGADEAVAEAKRQIGKPYEWGADGPDSFDCSGLTMWAWRAGGVSLPHSSRAQFSATRRVTLAQAAPGDLFFYGNPIHHVGIYVGNGQMVEASETGKPVRYASVHRRDLAGIGRVTG